MTSATGWTRHYYDAVEYYYWGPDKLECKRVAQPARVGAEAVLSRLRRLEEPLNHILTLFFDLIPPPLVQDLVRRVTGFDIASDVRLSDRAVHGAFAGLNVVQPDFLFEASDAVVSIELKIGAKSGLDQVLKYAALHQALRPAPLKSTALIYLTERPFDLCWPMKMTPDEVLTACADRLVGLGALGQLTLTDQLREDIASELGTMRLTALTLADLKTIVREWRIDADVTLCRLCDGIVDELEARGV